MAMAQERLATTSHWTWIALLTLRALWGERGPRHHHLDVASLSEHLQRDMGFLDGNDPSCKHR
jgi:hypothetical protein